MDKIQTLDELKKIKDGQEVGDIRILFMDISSTCTGYASCSLDFATKKATWKSAGALWLNPKWEHQTKYLYMHEAINNYFWIVDQIDYIVAEQYSINPKRMAGVCVVPEMQGAIKAAAASNGVKVDSILPQSWRAQLRIKKANGEYKTPTKNKVLEYVAVPETSISNITNIERTTPSDLYDAIGVGLGWLKKLGIEENDFSQIEFNTHIGVLENV